MAIFLQFLWLGCTSFGGPVAHLGIFRRVFVEQKHVFNESDYANLVALCQVIPGPASSQVGMGIGYRLGGVPGALAAFAGFTLPSALLMALGGWAVLSGKLPETSWLVTALKLVALGIVTQAVIGMWGQLCQTRETKLAAVIAAILFYIEPTALAQVGMIALALLAGHVLFKPEATEAVPATPTLSTRSGVVSLALYAVLLAVAVALPLTDPISQIVSGNYLSGALVFGGGHVVLPLLESEFVPPLSEDVFLAGYGLAQAMPGPLFTLGSYLGAVTWFDQPLLGALLATVAIFLPGALLLAGTAAIGGSMLPWLKPRLAYVNAVVVGLLLSVLVNPIFTESVNNSVTTALACVSLALTVGLKRSPLELVSVMVILTFAAHWFVGL